MPRSSRSAQSFGATDDEVTEITLCDEFAKRDEETNVPSFRPTTDRRLHPRFDADLIAVVYSVSGSFRTRTANLSEGGLRLAERLPAEFQLVGLEVLMIAETSDGPFDYYLFKAKAVGPRDDGRLQFTWAPTQTLTPYRTFLRRLETAAA